MRVFKVKNKKGVVWYIDYIDNKGIRHREVGGYTKKEAQAALHLVVEELKNGKYKPRREQKKPKLFKDFVKEYMDWAKVNKRSWERDEDILNHFIDFFGNRTLQEIKPHLIEEYKKERKEKGKKESTINRELACLSKLFNQAIDWEEATENPMRKVKKFKVKEKPKRVLSFEEEAKLLEAAAEHLKPIIICGLETGLRKSEILSLKWGKDSVDLDGRKITVTDTKNGKYRVIPISSYLYDTLSKLRRESGYVFCKADGTPYRDIKTAFSAAVKRAKIEHATIHSLRHTFCTRAVLAGTDLVTVKELAGHKDIKTTMIYAHPTPESKRMAVENLRSPLTDQWKESREEIKKNVAVEMLRIGKMAEKQAVLQNLRSTREAKPNSAGVASVG